MGDNHIRGIDGVHLGGNTLEPEGDRRQLMSLLHEQSCWANVCTEPGMVAFMAAKAASTLPDEFESIEVHLSGGILKNALSAGLPHTTEKGPAVAAAAGAISRHPEKGLTILGDLDPSDVLEAVRVVKGGRVTVKWDTEHDSVYGKCTIKGSGHTVEVIVAGSHTGVVEHRLDGNSLAVSTGSSMAPGLSAIRHWTFDRLIDAATSLDPKELQWLLKGAESCVALAEADSICELRCSTSTPTEAMAALSCRNTPMTDAAEMTFKAIQARMSGTPWPVLTSGGSGNQGIMISVPTLSIAHDLGLGNERIVLALAIAHGVNMLVKAYTGEVSASCGGISAGAGMAAGVCWMLGGNKSQIAEAVTEVLASLAGMVCDGAKATCALKGSTAVMTGLMAGAGASRSQPELKDQGVVGKSIDETLDRLETLSRRVFAHSDAVLLDLSGVEKV